MTNKTVHNYTIKLREDRVFDLYLDGEWIISKGSCDSILEALETIIKEND